MGDIFFSVLVAFKNREEDRVKRFLSSFENQDYKNFEVIFVDYGSDAELQKQIEALCAQFTFVNYLYMETRGYFWNKAHAVNTGLSFVKGDFVVFADIDMIHPAGFLHGLSLRVSLNKVYQYKCYLLPESFTDYHKLIDKNYLFSKSDEQYFKTVPLSSDYATGLGIYPINSIKKIQGYDEFYKLWGVEDLDIHKRAKLAGYEIEWLKIQPFIVYHQWHPKGDSLNPAGWYDFMWTYYSANQNYIPQESYLSSKRKLYTLTDRPALQLYLNKSWENLKRFKIEHPKVLNVSLIYNFVVSGSVRGCFIEFESANFKVLDSGIIKKVAYKINQHLEKKDLAYRITDLSHGESFISLSEVRDTIFYLLENFKSFIEDYYFEIKGTRLFCIIIKKQSDNKG